MIQVEVVFFVKIYQFIITAKNLIFSFLTSLGLKTQKNQSNFLPFAV